METVFGLFGLLLYIFGVLALAASVTLAVVKLTPQRRKKTAEPDAGS